MNFLFNIKNQILNLEIVNQEDGLVHQQNPNQHNPNPNPNERNPNPNERNPNPRSPNGEVNQDDPNPLIFISKVALENGTKNDISEILKNISKSTKSINNLHQKASDQKQAQNYELNQKTQNYELNQKTQNYELNQNSRLLALQYSQNHLLVVALPSFIPKHDPNSQKRCEVFTIGAGILKDVVAFKWHPLSSTCSHLLVLTSNGVLRMFNVLKDIDTPEQTFFVTASIQPDDPESGKSMQKAFGPNLDEFKATSFCIGSYQGSCSGWAPASVFATLQSGSVVCLCPVLPNEFEIEKAWVQETLDDCREEWNEYSSTHTTTDPDTDSRQVQFYWVSRYLQEILDQMDATGYTIVNRPLCQLTLARSGHCLFSPSCPVLDEENFIPADINLTYSDAGIPIISLLGRSGVVLVGMIQDSLLPLWLFNRGQPEFHIDITLVDALQLWSLESVEYARFKTHNNAPDTLFITSPTSLYQLQLDFVRHLADSTLNNTACLTRQLVQADSESNIKTLLLLSDLLSGISYICIDNQNRLVGDSIYPIQSIPPSHPSTTSNSQPFKTLLSENDKPFDYNLLGDQPRKFGLSSSVQQSTQKVYPAFIDEKTIKPITRDISNTREKIQLVIESFAKLDERIKVLQHQNAIQNTMLETCSQKLSLTSTDSLRERLEKIKRKHKKQNARLVGVLDLLFDLTQPQLSDAEIKWYQELSQLYKQSLCFYEPKLQELKTMLKQVQSNTSVDTEPEAVPEIFGTGQVRDIKQNLEYESKELKALQAKVERLEISTTSIEEVLTKSK